MPKRSKPSARRASSHHDKSEASGMRSIESLHHFQCGACRKWWSIGDAPKRARWFCPWCGRENRFASDRSHRAS